MTFNKSMGVMLTGLVVIALSGCRADEAATAAAPDYARTVERSADVDHVAAQPVEGRDTRQSTGATEEALPAGAVEMTPSADGATLETPSDDAAGGTAGKAPKPASVAH
ncbi:hypothetical protein [Stenotrophomonas indicatrix]|jgi:hypothetical protein|uniref:hypothetical protein n=1 Tax=Stenotrophomonas indicatrix TaxID=2045451 RepID=UPI00073977D4|nr:hypothetical protein [Stenotrophomonas indicatrix]QXQ03413.1 hypothetical protein KX724_04650 [Stenotrophomonas indicatrix]CRD63109.1 exported hypothetical protein [Stenotrophomonas indicatrix]